MVCIREVNVLNYIEPGLKHLSFHSSTFLHGPEWTLQDLWRCLLVSGTKMLAVAPLGSVCCKVEPLNSWFRMFQSIYCVWTLTCFVPGQVPGAGHTHCGVGPPVRPAGVFIERPVAHKSWTKEQKRFRNVSTSKVSSHSSNTQSNKLAIPFKCNYEITY